MFYLHLKKISQSSWVGWSNQGNFEHNTISYYKFTERPRRHNIVKDNWVVTFQSTHLSVWIGKEKMLEFDNSIIIGHLSKGSPANKISKVLHLWSNFVVGFWFAIYIKNLFQKFLKENINTNMNWLCHRLKTCSW